MIPIEDKVFILPNSGDAQEMIKALIDVLGEEYNNFPTHSMNEQGIYLSGQKDMLRQIIKMLKKEAK